jgi:lysophospholipase L1-like esterase
VRGALWVYVALLHVVVLVVVLKTNFLQLAGKTIGVTPPDEWNSGLVTRILQQAKIDRTVPAGRVILIGDSMVAQLDATMVASDAVNFGIVGDTTHTLLARLPVVRSIQHSRAVVLEIGVNDLKYRPNAEIARDYGAVLDELAGSPRVIAVSVLPVDPNGTAAGARSYLRNERIAALNVAIRTLCVAHATCRYLDAWPAMAEAAVYGSDGWHLSQAGDRVLAGLIHTALVAGTP